ncbi:MAG TPA: hypothetical protein VFF65_06975 [Phycisphaerales bacterium]|nr:hypothetical protein [Phycisphaerales bacterium]
MNQRKRRSHYLLIVAYVCIGLVVQTGVAWASTAFGARPGTITSGVVLRSSRGWEARSSGDAVRDLDVALISELFVALRARLPEKYLVDELDEDNEFCRAVLQREKNVLLTFDDFYWYTDSQEAEHGKLQVSAGWPYRSLHCDLAPDYTRLWRGAVNVRVTVAYGSGWWIRGRCGSGAPFPKYEQDVRPLPFRVHPAGLAANTLFFGAVAWGVSLVVGAVRRTVKEMRSPTGLCPACRYPITGLARCPECGLASAALSERQASSPPSSAAAP